MGKGERMDLHLKSRLETGVTVVSNTFIDKYMAEANGEYVKVYLYLLRRGFTSVSEEEIADALNDTEADVRRALDYWKKAGVLQTEAAEAPIKAHAETAAASGIGSAGPADTGERPAAPEPRQSCSQREMDKLSSDAEFTQLIYIAQQYLKKIFTPKDCEIFAYLYGTLKMPAELLEYLVEYCAQNNHTSLRYIEKVALGWYEKKLLTVEEAKAYSRSFSKDSFAVMKAFGLTGRSPADAEYKLLEKWYRTYGFTKELVLEACNRTMNAIHAPSFQYADKILTEWKTSGVRTMRDVEELDRIRQEQKARSAQGQAKDGQKARTGKGGRTANRFHNLEEHGYDYDKMVWNMINPGQDTEHTEQ